MSEPARLPSEPIPEDRTVLHLEWLATEEIMGNFRFIEVERQGPAFCVRLKQLRLDEREVYLLAEELVTLVTRDGCRRLALSLGPEPPSCLYSVFLARLVTLRRILRELGGELVLVDVGPIARSIFEAALLDRQFTFLPTSTAAVAQWAS
jgi:hypothetical protein